MSKYAYGYQKYSIILLVCFAAAVVLGPQVSLDQVTYLHTSGTKTLAKSIFVLNYCLGVIWWYCMFYSFPHMPFHRPLRVYKTISKPLFTYLQERLNRLSASREFRDSSLFPSLQWCRCIARKCWIVWREHNITLFVRPIMTFHKSNAYTSYLQHNWIQIVQVFFLRNQHQKQTVFPVRSSSNAHLLVSSDNRHRVHLTTKPAERLCRIKFMKSDMKEQFTSSLPLASGEA